MVPNIGLQFKWSGRRGRTIAPPAVMKNSSEHAKTLRNHGYRSRVSGMFNSLPGELRNIPTDMPMIKIKHRLDNFLKTLRDEPLVPGYRTDVQSNSVRHQRRTEDSPVRMIHR